jgi:hypothetical protein
MGVAPDGFIFDHGALLGRLPRLGRIVKAAVTPSGISLCCLAKSVSGDNPDFNARIKQSLAARLLRREQLRRSGVVLLKPSRAAISPAQRRRPE